MWCENVECENGRNLKYSKMPHNNLEYSMMLYIYIFPENELSQIAFLQLAVRCLYRSRVNLEIACDNVEFQVVVAQITREIGAIL